MLAPVLRPFHWPAAKTGSKGNEKVLGIEFAARTKSAANVAFEHVDRVDVEPQQLGEDFTIGTRHLGRTSDSQASGFSVPRCNEAARLHRHCRMTLDAEALAAPIGSHGKRRRRIAHFGVVRQRFIVRTPFKQDSITGPSEPSAGGRWRHR